MKTVAEGKPIWKAVKIGEVPEYTIHVPTKLITLLGKHFHLFRKGRSCEAHGQGIGAFAYYRRIVELCKNDLLDLIISVAVSESDGDALLAELRAAKVETQFIKAIGSVRETLPNSLYLENKNPLTTLHACLSKGIHELTDEECMERATAVRLVLANLTIRVADLRRDSVDLREALKKVSKS